MDDIFSKLERLNEQEVAKVFKLINKLAAKHADEAPQNRPEPVAEPPTTHTIKETTAPTKRRIQSLRDIIDDGAGRGRRGVDTESGGTTVSIKTRHGKVKVGRGAAKQQTRREPIQLDKNRPNNFLKMVESSAHKEDTEIDKKLWQGRAPTPRAIRAAEVWEIDCSQCGRQFDISPQEAFIDEEGDIKYTCDSCIAGKGGRG